VASSLSELLWVALLVYLLSGTIKGIVGIGLPTASIGLMSQFTDPRSAIALVIVPMVVTNAWQIYRSGYALRTAKRYAPFGVMLCIFIFISSGFAKYIGPAMLQVCVGLVVTLFAVDSLWRKPFVLNPRYDFPVQISAGILGGAMGGIAGIWSPTMVGYLIARQVDKDEFVRALGFMIFVGSIFLCFGYIKAGFLSESVAKLSALMVVPALIGFSLGEIIRQRLGAERFRRVVLIFFIVMGLNLVRRGLW